MHCAKRGSKIVCYEHINALLNPGEHPCKDCKAHAENGRVECPTLRREIELEDCNKQRGRSAREAKSYLKNF